MEDALRPPVLQRPPPSPSPDAPAHRSTISPFYYSLLGIASIALILLAYNIVVVGWCWQHHRARRRLEGYSSRSASNAPPKSVEGIPLYKYRKEETPTPLQTSPECPVCLSAFADGEDIRQLPKCKHLFHADCIDMWLYSHSNCPICRADVLVPPTFRGRNPAPAPAPADWERRSAEAVMAFGNVV